MSHLRWTLALCATLFAAGCVAENGDGTPADPPDPQLNPQPLPPVASPEDEANRSPTGVDSSSSSSSSGGGGSSGSSGAGTSGGSPPPAEPSSSSSSSSGSTTVGSGCKFPGLC